MRRRRTLAGETADMVSSGSEGPEQQPGMSCPYLPTRCLSLKPATPWYVSRGASCARDRETSPDDADAMRSYAHGTSPIPLLGETIGANLRRTSEQHPDREALVVRAQNYRATYRELFDATSALARALIASGIEQGDRVGIWSPNRFEWVITQFATARIGAILVNINPAYKSSELGYVLRQSGVKIGRAHV